MPESTMAHSQGRDERWTLSGDGLTLVGVDLSDVVAAGAQVELGLHWTPQDTMAVMERAGGADAQVRLALSWIDRQGSKVEAPIQDERGWSHRSLLAPVSPGVYDLRLELVDQNGRLLSVHCGWLARASEGCALATVHVTEATSAALANFDGRMLLLGAEIGVPVLSPGQMLPVTLHWQGLRSLEEDYTVSVQLVGPDGGLYGQEDAWPVQGTFPTSQWAPGERLTDPYQIGIAPDVPEDRYQVGVVVYLLATQTRLPLLDDIGNATGDIFWIGELEVRQR
jgi:hypothetical protein